MSKKKNNRSNYNRPNFWGMTQNVLIASLNKGQFILGLLGMSFLIMILKLTPKDTKILMDEILVILGNIYYIGWIIGIVSTIGWFLHAKKIRRIHSEEIKRMSEEKKKLQQKITNKKLRSSN